MKYNTRIAPSPTGPTHLGTVRTAYFNWLAARASGGEFIVRIDDTDRERSNEKWTYQFLKSLEWLGLDWDHLCYQSNSLDAYRACADSLVDMGLALRNGEYTRLALMEKNFPMADHWYDEIAGKVPIRPENIINFANLTLIGADGWPTYHFANCVDDIDLDINLVIRGVDHITNTAKHVLLYSVLGAPLPKYAHVGLLKTSKGKLSKRDAASDFQTYIDQGYDPDAMLNFLARLGWGPTVDNKTTKLLPKSKMLELFLDGGKMKNKDVMADVNILKSYDRKYKARKAKGELTNA